MCNYPRISHFVRYRNRLGEADWRGRAAGVLKDATRRPRCKSLGWPSTKPLNRLKLGRVPELLSRCKPFLFCDTALPGLDNCAVRSARSVHPRQKSEGKTRSSLFFACTYHFLRCRKTAPPLVGRLPLHLRLS